MAGEVRIDIVESIAEYVRNSDGMPIKLAPWQEKVAREIFNKHPRVTYCDRCFYGR